MERTNVKKHNRRSKKGWAKVRQHSRKAWNTPKVREMRTEGKVMVKVASERGKVVAKKEFNEYVENLPERDKKIVNTGRREYQNLRYETKKRTKR